MKRWMILFALASLLDGLITMSIINAGVGHEANPVMAFVLRGPAWIVVAYKALIPVIAWMILRGQKSISATWVLKFAFIGECLICAFNLSVLKGW